MIGWTTWSVWRRCSGHRQSGRQSEVLPQAVIDATVNAYRETSPRYGNKPACEWHFDALKRMLDKREPDYKD